MNKTAVVTGVTGQDGAYLAEFLLKKGYNVIGTYRRSSSTNFWRIEELNIANHPQLELIEFDLLEPSAAIRLLQRYMPDEVYNLAAQSFVGASFNQPIATSEVNALGPVNLLEAIRIVKPNIRFYQASTSEMFGKVKECPQSEDTPFYPRSPYGIAKLYAHWMVINYRESYDMFAVSGILFNHESPLRGQEFVTRKITNTVAKIKLGQLEVLELGNLNAQRDWGYAKEYVEGMWLMLQAKQPKDYVLATGQCETVRNFVTNAFSVVGINLEWSGEGVNEVAKDTASGKIHVKINENFYRPAEVELLKGCANKAQKELAWQPKTSLRQLCQMMVESDIEKNLKGISF